MEHGTTQKEEENPDPQIHEISADDQDGDSITPTTGINPGPDRDSSGEVEEKDCVIDVKHRRPGGESFSEEKICRICHMGPEGASPSSSSLSSELMELGCGCKDELGTCHRHCAEKWFRHRGNRECEICGKTANNIGSLTQERGIFAMEWHEMRLLMAASRNNSENRQHSSSCHCSQYCCKFLLACFLLALILPWFFRVDII